MAKKSRIIYGLLLSYLCIGFAQAEKVYRSVDETGVVEFSDRSQKDSQEMERKEVPTYKFIKTKPAISSTTSRTTKQQPATQIEITNPIADETILNNQGEVTVKLSLANSKEASQSTVKDKISAEQEPELAQDHKIIIYLDGIKVLEAVETSVILNNVDRGTHELKASVIDADGNVIADSAVVTFHMRRFSKLFKKPVNPVKPNPAPAGPTP